MKKIFAILALVTLGSVANAEMDDQGKTFSLITTNSDTVSYVLRGELEAVFVDVAATKTNVILVTDEWGETLFSKTVSADDVFMVRVPTHTTTGTLATATGGGATNDTINTVYGKYPLFSEVTIRAAGAADTTGTNNVTVRVIYSK